MNQRATRGCDVNWALVGASTIAGQFMIGAIRAQSDSDISWVVSGNAEHAADFAKTHKIATATTDIDSALADDTVDAVYISSTNEKHFEQAMAAISAGKHVLCEKPLSTSSGEAGKMIRAAADARVVLGVNHHLRCAGSHRAIHDLISSGKIGRVLSVRVFHAVHLPEHLRGWRLDSPSAGGGVIADLTVHNADTVRFLLGEDPKSVTAEMAATGMGRGVEDSAMSIWAMPSGAMVFSHDSFNHPHASSGVEVHGTEGSILAQGIMAQDPVGRIELVNAEGRSEVPFDKTGIYETAVGDFENAVAQGAAPAASGMDGLKSLLVAQAVRKAAESGTRQVVKYGVSV